jgi:hypothetical protein
MHCREHRTRNTKHVLCFSIDVAQLTGGGLHTALGAAHLLSLLRIDGVVRGRSRRLRFTTGFADHKVCFVEDFGVPWICLLFASRYLCEVSIAALCSVFHHATEHLQRAAGVACWSSACAIGRFVLLALYVSSSVFLTSCSGVVRRWRGPCVGLPSRLGPLETVSNPDQECVVTNNSKHSDFDPFASPYARMTLADVGALVPRFLVSR